MKITQLRTRTVRLPLEQPIPSGRLVIDAVECVLVFLDTDAGLTGEGLAFVLNGQRLAALHAMVQSFAPLVVGSDPTMSGEVWARAWRDMGFLGHRGATVVGFSPIDMALWDLRGKQCGLNVSRLLGACRESVPIYRTGGLRLSATIDGLQAEAAATVAKGFRALKMSLGAERLDDDVARVRAVREAIGPDIDLMSDCNQRFTVDQAIRLGHRLEPYGLRWIEEPVAYHDHAGEAAVAKELVTPVASGESEYTRLGMMDMLRLGSADILMPDLQRMGGPTEFMKVAQTAELMNVAVSPHLFTQMSLALAAALPGVCFVESIPWFDALYGRAIELDDQGRARVQTAPGWGYAFDPKAVERFAS